MRAFETWPFGDSNGHRNRFFFFSNRALFPPQKNNQHHPTKSNSPGIAFENAQI